MKNEIFVLDFSNRIRGTTTGWIENDIFGQQLQATVISYKQSLWNFTSSNMLKQAQLNDTLVSSSAITVTCSRDQRFHQRLQAAETQLTTDVWTWNRILTFDVL